MNFFGGTLPKSRLDSVKRRGPTLVRIVSLLMTLSSCLLATAPSPGICQPSAVTNKVIPLIVMEDVRLEDAIQNLAKMANINYVIDPKLSLSGVVSGRWENISAEQMLGKVLDQHNLKMTPNPATSVARVTLSNAIIKPITPGPVERNTNDIVPIFHMDEARLDDAARYLGGVADLKISFDPGLSEKTLGQSVTFRWLNLTARQALAALFDNYDLAMEEDPGSHTARVISKKQAAGTSSSTTK